MKKGLKVGCGIIFIGIAIFMGYFLYWIMTESPEAIAREEFEDQFDLKLKGEITQVDLNDYGQTLVKVKVSESNHKNYFPIYDPNKYYEEPTDIWEKRFFIKVQDSTAVFICESDEKDKRNHLRKGSKVMINSEKDYLNNMFCYIKNSENDSIRIRITTYPIRDNIR